MELVLIGVVVLAILAALVVGSACILSSRCERRLASSAMADTRHSGAPAFVRRAA